jgi:PAS domain S-box-containing protein
MSELPVSQSDISPEMIASFQKVFSDFQERAERLSTAYASMQEDFRKINLELDRKNSELSSSLQEQEKMQTYLDSILQSMENGVVGIDLNGTVTHFNRAAAEITGYDPDNVLKKSYGELFAAKANKQPELLEVVSHGYETAGRKERVIWHRDGHPVPVAYRHALLKDKYGNKIGAVEILSDISKIKALEEEMHQTRTMAVLGEMSATVAHEIRNPLGAMGMWAALLERDLDDEDPRRKTLGKIVEGLARLNKIVSNLLVFTRPVKAEFRKVDLVKTVEEIVDFVRIEIDRLEQEVIVNYSGPVARLFVLADPEKIGQVILNLCLNAIQAMPKEGVMDVELSDGGKEYALLVIRDTGCGIHHEDLEKIFDPFYTTKENGTGLGLAIVKKYIESHSGYIDIASTPGGGTSVKVFLPLLKE